MAVNEKYDSSKNNNHHVPYFWMMMPASNITLYRFSCEVMCFPYIPNNLPGFGSCTSIHGFATDGYLPPSRIKRNTDAGHPKLMATGDRQPLGGSKWRRIQVRIQKAILLYFFKTFGPVLSQSWLPGINILRRPFTAQSNFEFSKSALVVSSSLLPGKPCHEDKYYLPNTFPWFFQGKIFARCWFTACDLFLSPHHNKNNTIWMELRVQNYC